MSHETTSGIIKRFVFREECMRDALNAQSLDTYAFWTSLSKKYQVSSEKNFLILYQIPL